MLILDYDRGLGRGIPSWAQEFASPIGSLSWMRAGLIFLLIAVPFCLRVLPVLPIDRPMHASFARRRRLDQSYQGQAPANLPWTGVLPWFQLFPPKKAERERRPQGFKCKGAFAHGQEERR